MTRTKRSPVYQLRVSLAGIKPDIWRRLLLSGDTRIDKLHDILQRLMGWSNTHLHTFVVSERQLSSPGSDLEDMEDETRVRLSDIAPRVKDRFVYYYDLGDGWRHDVVVEEIAQADERFGASPLCIEGARACPPEDCGGAGGYEEFVAAVTDPRHERHEEMLEWNGGGFDPEAFDLMRANELIKRRRPLPFRPHRALGPRPQEVLH
jgi:hypothetical protein